MYSCVSPVRIKTGQFVPCGKCNFCKQARRMDWCFRLLSELRYSDSSYFVTLTYSNENLPSDGIPKKEELSGFIKRLRKFDFNKRFSPIRFYGVGELGSETCRPHYHVLLFNVFEIQNIEKAWTVGHVHVGKVDPPAIPYVTKYHVNANNSGGSRKEFALMSRRPGIGLRYVEVNGKMLKANLKSYVHDSNGIRRLPRYYRDKIFNVHEKQLLAWKSVLENDKKLVEEINRIGYDVYEQRKNSAHEKIKTKANENRKL